MSKHLFQALWLTTIVALPASATAAPDQAIQLAERAFTATSVAQRDTELDALGALPGGDERAVAAYAQGAAKFFSALEGLGQGLYRHGFSSPDSMLLPLLRLPVPENDKPEPLTYEGFRAIIEKFHTDMTGAAAQLSSVPAGDDFGIVVDLSTLRLDLNGDGQLSADESIIATIERINRRPGMDGPPAQPMAFRFDRADGIWLQGYANVLAAQADFWLAHDFRTSFDSSFHMLFPHARLPLQDLLVPPPDAVPSGMVASEWRFVDFISFIHTVNWPVVEPDRRKRARMELLDMVRLSRDNWQAIDRETDNDREWLPGPKQPGDNPLTGLSVGPEEVAGWMRALDMAEAVLDGRRLVPHFRFATKGIDLKKFFDESQPFDLVMTLTGPGAVPYLADGDIVTAEQFNDIQRSFRNGGFFTFAIWFN